MRAINNSAEGLHPDGIRPCEGIPACEGTKTHSLTGSITGISAVGAQYERMRESGAIFLNGRSPFPTACRDRIATRGRTNLPSATASATRIPTIDRGLGRMAELQPFSGNFSAGRKDRTGRNQKPFRHGFRPDFLRNPSGCGRKDGISPSFEAFHFSRRIGAAARNKNRSATVSATGISCIDAAARGSADAPIFLPVFTKILSEHTTCSPRPTLHVANRACQSSPVLTLVVTL